MKRIVILICIVLFISCSKSDEGTTPSSIITSVSSESVRIGDTIILTGQNLDRIQLIVFVNRFQNINVAPFVKTNELIKVKVPNLKDENFEIRANPYDPNFTPLHFKLIGTFQLPQSPIITEGLGSINMVTKDLAFVSDGSKIYKTVNGGYNWSLLSTLSSVVDIFFISENQGWVSQSKDLFFTNDGGINYNLVFQATGFGNYITQIYFTSENHGYILTNYGEIYETNNNSTFNLVYDCPYADEGTNHMQFDSFSIYNNSILATGEGVDNTGYIKKTNNSYSYVFTNIFIRKIQLVNETSAYRVSGAKLYFSNNITDWQPTSSFNITDFHFMDQNKGIGFHMEPGEINYIIYETFDGGQNWVHPFETANFELIGKDIDFYGEIGLIVGNDGKMWKHIFE